MNLLQKFIDWLKGLFFPEDAPLNEVVKPKAKANRVAICVGHSRKGDTGARSDGGVYEWQYNLIVAERLQKELKVRGISSRVFHEYQSDSYSGAMRWIASQTSKGFDIAIELHFNSYHKPYACGFEYLHFMGSAKGEDLAECFLKAHRERFPKQSNRGLKAVNLAGRGSNFLSKTAPPAVICEPFFGSNPNEWEQFSSAHNELAKAYAEGIQNYFFNNA